MMSVHDALAAWEKAASKEVADPKFANLPTAPDHHAA